MMIFFAGNISAKYLAEHTARMVGWRLGEVHLLVKEQESAVKAVRLERLVGDIGQKKRGRRKRAKAAKDDTSSKFSSGESAQKDDDEDDDELVFSEQERRRIMTLTELPRPWLSPAFNK